MIEPLDAARVRWVAGSDLSLSRDSRDVIAGIVVWDVRARCVVEQVLVRRRCRFPYVPGLLSFRETPGILAAWRRLRGAVDVLLCDAQGIAHPRRFGLACHVGLWLDRPTIGCAKSRLCGEFGPPGAVRGDRADLLLDGQRVGTVLRTRAGVKPLFVSPGHRCDVDSACRVVLASLTRFRLPEPTRLAHQLVTRARA
ncbi:MAG: Endonuclease V [Phycisphaerae bacterium]|nr:Endonuclease V [Phycisphaerae bacterium]